MKKSPFARLPRLAAAALPLLGLAGCCAGYHNHSGLAASCECPGYETPLCFGYFSTCWRSWPEECPTCPPFTLPPPAQEQVLPTPAPSTPAPMPMPGEPPPTMPPLPGAAAPAAPAPPPMQPPSPPPDANSGPTLPPPQEAQMQPPGEEGLLRRRWVEGGFVTQPASYTPAEQPQGP